MLALLHMLIPYLRHQLTRPTKPHLTSQASELDLGSVRDVGTAKAGTKKQKTQKKPGDKPQNTKQPPTTDE